MFRSAHFLTSNEPFSMSAAGFFVFVISSVWAVLAMCVCGWFAHILHVTLTGSTTYGQDVHWSVNTST